MAALPRAQRVTEAEWSESVTALLDLGRSDEALNTLERAVTAARERRAYEGLLALLGRFPEDVRQTSAARRLHLRLLGNLPGYEASIPPEVERQWAQGRNEPFLQVFLAWVLSEQHDDAASLAHSDHVLEACSQLTPFERALLWRTRAISLARLGRPGWEEAFGAALQDAQGRGRAMTLLDRAACQTVAGDLPRAMASLSEAEALCRRDPLEVRVAEQLGRVCLRAGEFVDAERHFGRMVQLASRAGRARLQSRALCSLALTRRVMGEWERAEQLYEDALKAAVGARDEDDQRQALRGLGHTRRLSGRPLSALESLERAARAVRADRESGRSWVQVDIAAALVSLRHFDEAAVTEALARTGPAGQEDTERAEVVRAELSRRGGDGAGALKRLGPLPMDTLWTREEAHAFPDLFDLLPATDRPQPLPRPPGTVVALRALGLPQVKVNGREVTVPSLAVVALAALLDHGGEASLDTLREALDDGRPRNPRQAEQRVSKIVVALRRALGWKGSVRTRPGSYALDDRVSWTYDVRDALEAGQPTPAFLSGLDLRWVSEREQALSLRD